MERHAHLPSQVGLAAACTSCTVQSLIQAQIVRGSRGVNAYCENCFDLTVTHEEE